MRCIFWACIISVILVPPRVAAGAQETATVPITATLESVFSLSCAPTQVNLAGRPGEVVSNRGAPVRCAVTSNWVSDHWGLKIQATGPLTEISNPPLTIPIVGLFHRSRCAANCTPANIADASNVPFHSSAAVHYQAAPQERNNLKNPTQIETIYELQIPTGQPAGTYRTTVIHILTVNF